MPKSDSTFDVALMLSLLYFHCVSTYVTEFHVIHAYSCFLVVQCVPPCFLSRETRPNGEVPPMPRIHERRSASELSHQPIEETRVFIRIRCMGWST